VPEPDAVLAPHQDHHLVTELERVGLELDPARTDVEQEPKVDVRDATAAVDHNVAVVPVLDLDDVAQERVRRHGLDKVGPGALKVGRLDGSELHREERQEVVDLGSAHFVTRGRVRNDIDDTALSDSAKNGLVSAALLALPRTIWS
jgi:hypothetical protein